MLCLRPQLQYFSFCDTVLLLGELRPASSACALGPMGICVAHILLEPDLPTRLHRSSERSRGHRKSAPMDCAADCIWIITRGWHHNGFRSILESPEKSKKGSRRRGLATAGATKRIAPAARSTGAVGASVAGRERARDCAAAVSWRPRSSTSPLLPRTRVALDRMYARVHLEPATSHSRSRAASASERSVQRRAARSFPRTSALCDCSQQRWRPLRRFRH